MSMQPSSAAVRTARLMRPLRRSSRRAMSAASRGESAGHPSMRDPFFAQGSAAIVRAGESRIGMVGEVHPLVREDFGLLARPVCFFELDLGQVLPHVSQVPRFQELPRYPAVSQDLSILVHRAMPAARVQEIIASFPLVRRVTLFDVFTGGQLPPDKRSLSYSILYQSPERTLTGEEVAQVHKNIIQRLEQELGATLRS